jgi:hypothetical protein
MLRSSLLACLALASLAAVPQLASADLCREVVVRDRIETRCFSCRSPDSFEERSACDEVCSDPELRRQESSCPLSDEERRRAQPCRNDEVPGPDGTCSQVRCGIDERVENGRCVPGACEPGRVLVDGQCVKPKKMAQNDPPPPMCIDAPKLKEIEDLVEDAETITEARFVNVIALAVVKLSDVELPGGKTVKIPPQDESPEAKRIAESIDKLAKDQGLACDVGTLLGCAEPFSQRVKKQTDDVTGDNGILEKVTPLVQSIEGAPDYARCLATGNTRTIRIQEISKSIREELRARIRLINEYFDAVDKEALGTVVTCLRPSIDACGMRLVNQPPNKPIAKAAKRKLNNPMGGATPED